MLRSLVDEVVRRRLLPVVLVALLVIVAAPLLFMKSAPEDAPAASDAPSAASPGKLPANAKKLLVTSDKAATPRHRAAGSGQDPFAPPASAEKPDASAAAATPTAAGSPTEGDAAGPGAKTLTGEARKVTIENPDGSTTTISTDKKAKKKAKKKAAAKPKAKQQAPAPQTSPVRNVALVNVRYGSKSGARARRVPRLQTFKAGGSVVAMFVKYSPARDKAVFAIAPSTVVSGDVKCRRKEGVCRFVDIPEGKHVRLTTRTAKGAVVSRRLDVVSIEKVTKTAAAVATPTPAPRTTPLAEATCLLKNLLALPSVIFPSISVDACD